MNFILSNPLILTLLTGTYISTENTPAICCKKQIYGINVGKA